MPKQTCDVTRIAVLEERIAALESKLELHIGYNDRAIKLATDELRRRLEGMNEFREALKDQAATFMSREAVELQIKPLEELVRSDHDTIAKWLGALAATIFISGALSALVSYVMK